MPPTIATAAEDLRSFFLDPDHWIYRSKGTPSDIGPDSVYHIAQLQVLFEDRYFHFLTGPAIQLLKQEGFLAEEIRQLGSISANMVWRKNVRYTARPVRAHMSLLGEYSSNQMSRATGNYAEILTLSGLRALHADLISRNARDYRGRTWTNSSHDLDFIVERKGVGYGVEVKNTWDYMPQDELRTKLAICRHLGLRPLFIVRTRHSGQHAALREAGGLLYMFKTKVFPPGQEDLTKRIWQQMRLPVGVWNDFPGQFHATVSTFMS